MKKLFVAVALVMGIGTSVFAYNMNPASIETVTTVNDFTPIEVKDLPAAVQEAITKNYADLTIKEASVEAKEDGTKTYKVVLTDKEGTESTVLFSESGERECCEAFPFLFLQSISKPFHKLPAGTGAVNSISSFETGCINFTIRA